MSTSSDVTPGTDATATQYNNLRADARLRKPVFVFDLKGVLVVGNNQIVIPVPVAMTITKIKYKIVTGTSATFTIKADSTDVKAGIVAGTSYADDSTITNPSVTEGQELILNITATSGSPDSLRVLVYGTYNI